MTTPRQWALMGAVLLIELWSLPLPARAVEYRLQVANLYEQSFAAFLVKPSELGDGASGPGLERLEASLDRGEVPKGALLYDRHLQPVGETVARAYAAVRVVADVRLGGEDRSLWDEVRWQGKPGEQTVWLVKPRSRRPQELVRVALKGLGPLRHFQAWSIPQGQGQGSAVRFPLHFLSVEEEKGTVWQRYVSPVLDLGRGIAAVVGVNDNRFYPDQVYLIVSQDAVPTSYKAVLAWRPTPGEDIETPPRKRQKNIR